MYVLLTILILIAAVLLILIVLVQNSKGGGLASNFAGSNQVMGVRQTSDFLEKATWGLAGTVIVLSIAASLSIKPEAQATDESMIKDQVENAASQSVIPTTAPQAQPETQPTTGDATEQ